jgi:predicted AlkP superfamily phosphohydrolase/phosphomutase
MLVYRAPDILCHKFWRYQDPAHPLYDEREAAQWGDVISGAFEYLDALNARLLDRVAGDDTTVLVLSDHGFGPLTHAVYLNRYFAERGFLGYRARPASPLTSALRTGVRRLNNPLVGALKQRAFDALPALKSSLHYSMAYGAIDWAQTRAYAVGTMGNVYLNLGGREPEGIVEPTDYERVRAAVIEAMRELRDPETGALIFDAVYRREELYHGDALDEAPDIVGLIDGPYHVAAVDWRPEDGGSRPVVEKLGDKLLFVSDTSGQHRMDGILVAAGAGIARAASAHAPPPSLIDLAPTILHLLGEAVPDDMDGRVLREFLTDARAVERAPGLAHHSGGAGDYSIEEQKAIEERLAGLGYLG